MKTLAIVAALLLLASAPAASQTTLGDHGGSDSLAQISSTAWAANAYTFGTIPVQCYVWVKNLSSTADLGIGFDKDTTSSGTFGKFQRLEPGQETLWIPTKCQTIYLKSLKAATTVPARINIVR